MTQPTTTPSPSSTSTICMPTRIIRNYLSDSRVWSQFMAQGGFVKGDIIVADPFKAGTTWTQQIITQILCNGQEGGGASGSGRLTDSSPWLDSSWGDHSKMLATLQDQRKRGVRRVIKSHLPADALPLDSQARYIFVGRNGKDLGISFHNYLRHFTPDTISDINHIHASWARNNHHTPLTISPNLADFFDHWLDEQGGHGGSQGTCDLLDVMSSWWDLRDHPNVLLLHYHDMVHDLPTTVRRVTRFLGLDDTTLDIEAIVQHCSFGYMKDKADKMAPFGGGHMVSAKVFFDKGPARDFSTELSQGLIDKFDDLAKKNLPDSDCVAWLEHGGSY